MLRKFYISFFLVFLAFALSASAVQLNLPVKTIGSTQFYYYKISSKETVYGIAKKLGISKDDILKYNPSASEGIKSGQLLFFPVAEFSAAPKKAEEPEQTYVAPKQSDFTHKVAKGETLYGLSKTYGITPEEIIKANHGVENGLKEGEILVIPQSSQQSQSSDEAKAETPAPVQQPEQKPVAQQQPSTQPESPAKPAAQKPAPKPQNKIIYHTIVRGETLYSVAKKYNTTIAKILRLNPGVSPTNFQADAVIKILPNSHEAVLTEKTVPEFYPYEIKDGDTFYSIASANGITVERLQQANPDVKKLKKGKIIYIPREKKEKVLAKVEEISQVEGYGDNNSPKIKHIYDSVHTVIANKPAFNIVLMFPYMLNSSRPSKQAQLYTEFYKGFLMAVDSLKLTTNKELNIYTYDTENSLSTIDGILGKPELKKADIIFAPGEPNQISAIARFAKENDINVVNSFSLKNEDYNSNSHIFQVNIPHSFLYASTIDWFNETFDGWDIVFLKQAGHDSETKDFIAALKKQLKESKKFRTHTVTFKSSLAVSDFGDVLDPGKRYLIVPLSGSQSALKAICPTLKKIKSDRYDVDLAMFGYPEWATYSSMKNDLQRIDTYIYSRFFFFRNQRMVNFENKFHKWYNTGLINAAPRFGVLGFDEGMFFLKSIIQNDNDFNASQADYNGMQTDFKFKRLSNWSGFVNKAIYIVHYSPDFIIEKTVR
jgi:LysM repeat protein